MARPTDAQRILKFLSDIHGGKASIPAIASAMEWPMRAAHDKVKRAVQAGILFYSATTGLVTRKRKSASPDKGKVQSRRATNTRKQAKQGASVAPREQLELPLVVTQAIAESANG